MGVIIYSSKLNISPKMPYGELECDRFSIHETFWHIQHPAQITPLFIMKSLIAKSYACISVT